MHTAFPGHLRKGDWVSRFSERLFPSTIVSPRAPRPLWSAPELGAATSAALAALEGGRTGLDVTGLVDWEAEKRDVATVVGGLVTGVGVGETELSVRDPLSGEQSERDAAVVTVQPAPDPDAELLEIR